MKLRDDSSQLVPHTAADIRAKPARKAHGRSRITNGRDVLPDVDGRSIIARRFRDIVNAMIADCRPSALVGQNGLIV
jgi:hypothetical protein